MSLVVSEYELSTAASICLFPFGFPHLTNNPGQLPILGSVFSWTTGTRTCGRLTGAPQKYQVIFTSLGLLHLYQKYTDTQINFTQVYLSAKTKSKMCFRVERVLGKYFSSALVFELSIVGRNFGGYPKSFQERGLWRTVVLIRRRKPPLRQWTSFSPALQKTFPYVTQTFSNLFFVKWHNHIQN